MSKKSLMYIGLMLIGSYILSFVFFTDFVNDPDQLIPALVVGSLYFPIPFITAILIDPIVRFVKIEVFKKVVVKDPNIKAIDDYIENVVAYFVAIPFVGFVLKIILGLLSITLLK